MLGAEAAELGPGDVVHGGISGVVADRLAPCVGDYYARLWKAGHGAEHTGSGLEAAAVAQVAEGVGARAHFRDAVHGRAGSADRLHLEAVPFQLTACVEQPLDAGLRLRRVVGHETGEMESGRMGDLRRQGHGVLARLDAGPAVSRVYGDQDVEGDSRGGRGLRK